MNEENLNNLKVSSFLGFSIVIYLWLPFPCVPSKVEVSVTVSTKSAHQLNSILLEFYQHKQYSRHSRPK